jgi:two-component system NtrC family sensor kinase
VDGLLTFARRRTLTFEPVNMNEVIRDSLRLYRDYLSLQGITLQHTLASSLPSIRGDISALQQVVLNLLSNAATAVSSNDGRRCISIRTYCDGALVVTEVTDNGKGVPTSLRTRVFEPFYTTSEPGRGTGLGLSICHGIVAEHDGSILVRGRGGGGATFVVQFPRAE